MLDDLLDEGYTELNNILEETYSGVSKLKAYLEDNHIEPFPIYRKPFSAIGVTYEQCTNEVAEAIRELAENARKSTEKSTDLRDGVFLSELIDFCKWIGYEEETVYIFFAARYVTAIRLLSKQKQKKYLSVVTG